MSLESLGLHVAKSSLAHVCFPHVNIDIIRMPEIRMVPVLDGTATCVIVSYSWQCATSLLSSGDCTDI